MSNEEKSYADPMEYIWDQIPKNKEGIIHYLSGDIPYLYEHGFVDTDNYTYDEWSQAFDDCKQSDGSFLITKEKFLSLGFFRYSGPTWEPFNPQLLKKGEWTDVELADFFDNCLSLSSSISEDVFWNSVKALKDDGHVSPQGQLVVDDSVRRQVAYLVDRFPFPRRRLEMEVSRIRKEREGVVRKAASEGVTSVFVSGKIESEVQQEKFKKLETKSSGKPKSAKAAKEKVPEGIDLKKLRKPSPKMRG